MTQDDRPRALCRKFIIVDGDQVFCNFEPDHPGLCGWALVPHVVTEDRDAGPYEDAAQALAQFANWSHGMPVPMDQSTVMLVLEALLAAGVTPTEYEQNYLVAHRLDPILATIIHGWLIHAGR